MSKKDDIRHLWKEGFRDSDEYLDMYFDRIYRDSDALTISADGKLQSTLIAQPYALWFNNREVPITYLAGAVTRRSARGRGLMSQLIRQAISEAAQRGDMMCALIPAHGWLYYFFERFGFSSVFLSDIQRFTSLHRFGPKPAEDYHTVDDPYSEAVYDAFARFERRRPGGVLHSQRDFINVLDDLAMQTEGTFIAVGRRDTEVAAMVWAVGKDEIIQVNELLGIDEEARNAALRSLRARFPDRPLRFVAPADSPQHRNLYPRGMARIVNAGLCLATIAEANPTWRSRIRVSDPMIAENNHTFITEGGQLLTDDTLPGTAVDLDVDISVLANIIFSSPETGRTLGFPSCRTHISLMPH